MIFFRYCFFLFSMTLTIRQSIAQNLVLNPSFEEGLPEKPIRKRTEEGVAGRTLIKHWIVPNGASPDVFNSPVSSAGNIPCAMARSGKGVVGMVLAESKNMSAHYGGSFKEYIQGSLISPLESGVLYSVEFYMALDRSSGFTAKNIGVYFSEEAIIRKEKTGFDVEASVVFPNDSLVTSRNNWVKVRGTYSAKGGERYLTIGAFGQDYMQPLSAYGMKPEVVKGHTHRNAYYYIDDVSVMKKSEADLLDRNRLPLSLVLLADPGPVYDEHLIRIWTEAISVMGKSADSATLFSVYLPSEKPVCVCEKEAWTNCDSKIAKAFSAYPFTGKSKKYRDELIGELLRKMSSDSLPEQHLIVMVKGKTTFSSSAREMMRNTYEQKRISTGFMQWGGKESRDLKNFIRKTGGIYKTETSGFVHAFTDLGIETTQHKNRVQYAEPNTTRTLYFLGAAALVAIMIIGIV